MTEIIILVAMMLWPAVPYTPPECFTPGEYRWGYPGTCLVGEPQYEQAERDPTWTPNPTPPISR